MEGLSLGESFERLENQRLICPFSVVRQDRGRALHSILFTTWVCRSHVAQWRAFNGERSLRRRGVSLFKESPDTPNSARVLRRQWSPQLCMSLVSASSTRLCPRFPIDDPKN